MGSWSQEADGAIEDPNTFSQNARMCNEVAKEALV